MSLIHVEVSAIIDAPAEDLYAVARDYRVGHPAILPKPYFTELTVEKGGIGAGTELTVRMEIFGQQYTYHQIVSEPEPGRRLVEANIDNPGYSTFLFEPLAGGRQTRVTISSELVGSGGMMGLIERLMTPIVTRHIYKKELRQLAEYVKRKRLAAVV